MNEGAAIFTTEIIERELSQRTVHEAFDAIFVVNYLNLTSLLSVNLNPSDKPIEER